MSGFLQKVRTVYWKCINIISLVRNGVVYTHSTRLYGHVFIRVDSKERLNPSIVLGNDMTINSGQKYNPIGGDSCTILRTVGNGKIKIGDRVGISNAAIVAFSDISIGNDVLIGGGVKIYDSDFHSLSYSDRITDPYLNIRTKPIKIEDGAFIGANTIILKGVTIGKRSVVGAGSVVRENIPDDEIWAGNPAKFIRRCNK